MTKIQTQDVDEPQTGPRYKVRLKLVGEVVVPTECCDHGLPHQVITSEVGSLAETELCAEQLQNAEFSELGVSFGQFEFEDVVRELENLCGVAYRRELGRTSFMTSH